jgi:hypothetical protein
MDTSKGMDLLKEKMKDRLEKIKSIRGSPTTRVRLIRSRIVSAWNYTAAVQDIDDSSIAEIEKDFYNAIVMGELRDLREDLVYENEARSGLGMTKLSEEYRKNKLRTLTQIMEAGERMKGRGQVPWAQKLLMEEMSKPEPCLKVIAEMKTLTEELGLSITKAEDKYKAWTNQQHMEEVQGQKIKLARPLSNHQVEVGQVEVPLSLLEYFKMQQSEEDKEEPLERAIRYMKERNQILQEQQPE